MVLPTGKVPVTLLARLLSRHGPLPPEVVLGPAVGEDACGIDLPGGVLVVSTDPITLAGRNIGRYAVTVNANDIAATGVRPRWFLASFLFPPGTTESELDSVFFGLQAAVGEIGVALVGGHTEVTNAVSQPIVVGQMLGLAEDRRVVRTGGVTPGQVVFQIGRAPIEGAAVLADRAGSLLGGLECGLVRAAQAALETPGISVVGPALLATRLGCRAMHDPTEGGLAAGLHELAAASGVRLRVDRDRVLWWNPATALCQAVGADPWATLASGSLLAAFDEAEALTVADRFRQAGHEPAIIAVAETGTGVIDTHGEEISWPERDELSRVLENVSKSGG